MPQVIIVVPPPPRSLGGFLASTQPEIITNDVVKALLQQNGFNPGYPDPTEPRVDLEDFWKIKNRYSIQEYHITVSLKRPVGEYNYDNIDLSDEPSDEQLKMYESNDDVKQGQMWIDFYLNGRQVKLGAMSLESGYRFLKAKLKEID